jgi:hypothetical protein
VTLLQPAVFEARTMKRWLPFASPPYVHGELQATAAPVSSAHVTLVGDPLVRHANVAVREPPLGTPVSCTVGRAGWGAGVGDGVGDGVGVGVGGGAGVGVPLSSTVPKSCVQ